MWLRHCDLTKSPCCNNFYFYLFIIIYILVCYLVQPKSNQTTIDIAWNFCCGVVLWSSPEITSKEWEGVGVEDLMCIRVAWKSAWCNNVRTHLRVWGQALQFMNLKLNGVNSWRFNLIVNISLIRIRFRCVTKFMGSKNVRWLTLDG